MSVTQENFKAQELCSRKLWEVVTTPADDYTDSDLAQAVAELAQRRHYLEQLKDLGKLNN